MCLFSFHFFSSKGWASCVRVCWELGFELISFVQPAPASHLCLQPVGKHFCFLFSVFFSCFVLFCLRGKEREERNDKCSGGPAWFWARCCTVGATKNASEVAGEAVPGNVTEIPVPLAVLRPILPWDHMQEGVVLGKHHGGCCLDFSCLMCPQDPPDLKSPDVHMPCLVQTK